MNLKCPVCLVTAALTELDKHWIFGGEAYYLTCCTNCGSAYTNPLPSDEILRTLYTTSFDYRWYQDFYPAKLKDSQIRIEEYKGILGKRVLDFGGGIGYFSQAARDAGYDSVTHDPFTTSGAVDAGVWDTVVALHVLEHANNLDRICGQIKELLVPGGRVILAVPNFAGRGYREQGMQWVWAQPPLIHVFHFTAKGVSSLLSRHGFIDIELSYRERWDANLYCDVQNAEKFRNWDRLWSLWPFNVLPIYRKSIANLNSYRRFLGLEQSMQNFDMESDIYSELQITAILSQL